MLKSAKRQLKLLGRIRKGDPKTRNSPGRNTKHFRLDASVAGKALQSEVEDAFAAVYGEKPDKLKVLLPFDTTEECLHAFKEEWVGSSLIRRCDEERQIVWLAEDKKSFCDSPKPCIAPQCGCKTIAKLKVLLPDVKLFGYFEILSTSWHDAQTMQSQLMYYEYYIGKLKGLPLLISRDDKMISKPMGSKRVRSEESLIQIDLPPQLQQQMLGQWDDMALALKSKITDVLPPTPERLALPAIDPNDIEGKKLALIQYTMNLLNCDDLAAEAVIKQGKQALEESQQPTTIANLKDWLRSHGNDLAKKLQQKALDDPPF